MTDTGLIVGVNPLCFWQYSTLMSLISITLLLLPPPSAGARDLVRIFNNVSTSTDVCLTRILRHPLNKILLPPIFFTESFAITPTTLALLNTKYTCICISLCFKMTSKCKYYLDTRQQVNRIRLVYNLQKSNVNIVTTRGFLERKENSLFVFLPLNILCLESRTKSLVFAALSVLRSFPYFFPSVFSVLNLHRARSCDLRCRGSGLIFNNYAPVLRIHKLKLKYAWNSSHNIIILYTNSLRHCCYFDKCIGEQQENLLFFHAEFLFLNR